MVEEGGLSDWTKRVGKGSPETAALPRAPTSSHFFFPVDTCPGALTSQLGSRLVHSSIDTSSQKVSEQNALYREIWATPSYSELCQMNSWPGWCSTPSCSCPGPNTLKGQSPATAVQPCMKRTRHGVEMKCQEYYPFIHSFIHETWGLFSVPGLEIRL